MITDYVFTGIGAICTLVSVCSARKASKYYKKSQNLTLFANNNVAYTESQKIVDTFTQLLKLANSKIQHRGSSIPKAVSQYGENIKKSLNIIRDKLPAEDYDEIEKILKSSSCNVEQYIDSIIACSTLEGNTFPIDENFNNAQRTFHSVQRFLKTRSEKLEETIRS